MIDFSQLAMQVSRTEQKKAHERLQKLAIPLANLSKKNSPLPFSSYFIDELCHLASITHPNAKNRQIKRVGKLMADESRHDLVAVLFAHHFDTAQQSKITAWQNRLSLDDDNTLKQFVRHFARSEYHTLYQLLLWIEYAKHLGDDELLAESYADLASYIKEVALLEQLD